MAELFVKCWECGGAGMTEVDPAGQNDHGTRCIGCNGRRFVEVDDVGRIIAAIRRLAEDRGDELHKIHLALKAAGVQDQSSLLAMVVDLVRERDKHKAMAVASDPSVDTLGRRFKSADIDSGALVGRKVVVAAVRWDSIGIRFEDGSYVYAEAEEGGLDFECFASASNLEPLGVVDREDVAAERLEARRRELATYRDHVARLENEVGG